MSGDWRERLRVLLDDYAQRAAPVGVGRYQRARDWQAELDDNHLAAPGWPVEVGGLDLDLDDQLDYYRMTSAAGVPSHPCPLALIVAPTLILHGTPEQRQRFLKPLIRADELWCQGFSEPGAGSDLASLSTKAVRAGDDYIVTGQKVWTTQAERADWIFVLARTSPLESGVKRQTDGITYLLIPMDAPGVTVRPLRDISGVDHFAEVYLDDVRVPVTNRVGAEGEGWSIMRTSLGHERATAFLADEFRYRRTVDKVVGLVIEQGLDSDALVRQQIARVEVGVRAIAANSARALAAVLRGEDPGAVASVNRLVKSEFEQQMHSLALRATGPHALLGSRATDAVQKGKWTYGYLMSRATTIGAGTAEIQRNTIAESVLGLPSHRGEKTRSPAGVPGRPLAVATEDERDLREALAKALEDAIDLAVLLDQDRPVATFDDKLWRDLVGFGLPGLDVPEPDGGGGASTRLLCAAVEECARVLASVPLVPSIIALAVLRHSGASDAVRRVSAGTPAAFVVPLHDAGWVTDGIELPEWDGNALRGLVPLVGGAPAAELLVVLARGADGSPVLLQVDADAAAVDAQPTLDLTTTIGTVRFDRTPAVVLADGDVVTPVVARARRIALLVTAADAVGVASRALHMSTLWAGEREQFGRPIGSFQAISHRLADTLVDVEGARNLVLAAADMDLDNPEAEMLVDLAAATAFDCAVTGTQTCLQVHGGIGFTWEHPTHLLLRKASADAIAVGRADALRDRAARALVSTASKVAREDNHL